MIENKQQYQEYERVFVMLFEVYKLQLDQDSIDFVQRNIKAAELEMAYEGLVHSRKTYERINKLSLGAFSNFMCQYFSA